MTHNVQVCRATRNGNCTRHESAVDAPLYFPMQKEEKMR